MLDQESIHPKNGWLFFSPPDQIFADRVKIHAAKLLFGKQITLPDEILPGSVRDEEINRIIEKCDFAILLVSADMYANQFMTEKALPLLIKASHRNEIELFPLLIGSCLYETDECFKNIPLVNPGYALKNQSEGKQDDILNELIKTIQQQVVESSRKQNAFPSLAPLMKIQRKHEQSESLDALVARTERPSIELAKVQIATPGVGAPIARSSFVINPVYLLILLVLLFSTIALYPYYLHSSTSNSIDGGSGSARPSTDQASENLQVPTVGDDEPDTKQETRLRRKSSRWKNSTKSNEERAVPTDSEPSVDIPLDDYSPPQA